MKWIKEMFWEIYDCDADKDYMMFTFWRITIKLWEIK